MRAINRTLIKTLFALFFSLVSIPSPSAQEAMASCGPSIGEFLTPEGRFDLDAARSAGLQGSLNTKGFESGIDAEGRPVFRAAVTTAADDIYWDNRLSPSTAGVRNIVLALTVFDGKLIAGGWFETAGGVWVNHIAAWDGSEWSPVGSGINGSVAALTVFDGKLIAGGRFKNAGKVSANHIAVWDGSAWSPLGSGMNDAVAALKVYDGKLIAGGSFTTVGGDSAKYIASWDGSAWSPLGEGVNNGDYYSYINTLTVYDGRLIAGGRFTVADGVSVNGIAEWDGSAWSPLGEYMDFPVHALSVYDGKLIAGGYFTTADGVLSNHIAAWNGSEWSPLGEGMRYGGNFHCYICALTVFDGKLIAGGQFMTAGGVSANYIAAWDGTAWSPLGSGMNDVVRAFALFDGKLIAGGTFTTAGVNVASRIAAWTKKDPVAVSERSPIPSSVTVSQNHPNPFNPSTTIEFSVPADSRVTLTIFNITGQRVAELVNEKMPAGRHSAVWNAAGMPSGVYFCTVKSGIFEKARKMLLLK